MDRITVTEAAKRLKISRPRVLVLIREKRLPAEMVGMQFLIKPGDLSKVRDRKPGRPRKTAK